MIRKIQDKDTSAVIEMMREFYSSDAVYTNGSEEIFARDIAACLSGEPYIEGWVFEEDGSLQGYAFLAKSFSTEFGRHCIWLEDLFIERQHRGKGLAKDFLSFISEKYSNCIIRLEVEDYNRRAVEIYEKAGFVKLPYEEMVKLNGDNNKT